jgi:FtsP/CotA-like multicopper oxidase with cupredoxin domain
MLSIPRIVMIVCCVLTLASFSSNAVPDLMAPAIAQNAPARQYTIVITDRKVEAAVSVVRVTQGDAVEIVLTSDEAAELHLHGYDLEISLTPNMPGTLKFTAKIAGRFPLEAHRFGAGSNSGRQRGKGPLLYVEVHPR